MQQWAQFVQGLVKWSAITLVTATGAYAESLTRNEYATLWRDACVAQGTSSLLPLTATEVDMFNIIATVVAGYHAASKSFGMKTPSISSLNECGCVAVEISTHKKNLSAPTSDVIVLDAFDKCMSQPIR